MWSLYTSVQAGLASNLQSGLGQVKCNFCVSLNGVDNVCLLVRIKERVHVKSVAQIKY